MDQTTGPRPNLRFRTVFISDVHLGFKGCRAEYLLDFLRASSAETIYLVGRHRRPVEPEARFLLASGTQRRASHPARQRTHGTRVVYVPGNHDRAFRDLDGLVLGHVEIANEAVHETADGRRFLVAAWRRIRRRHPRESAARVAGQSRLLGRCCD